MFKKFLAPMTLICALALSLSARGADDDVFLDEGNGDFDAMPLNEPAPVAEEQPPAPPSPGQQEEPMPLLTEDAGGMPGMEEAPVEQSAPVQKASKPKKEKVVKAEPKAPKASPKKVAKASSGKGSFVTTKDACPMLREPASTSETMLTVKPARKIWVEQAETGWVKGFNKAGEAGYISQDCVE